jgi:hypothetical protein
MTWHPSPDWFLAFLEEHPFPDTDAIRESIRPWVTMSQYGLEKLQALAFGKILVASTGNGHLNIDQTRIKDETHCGFFVEWAGVRWDPKGQHPDWRHERTRVVSTPALPFYQRWIQKKPKWTTYAMEEGFFLRPRHAMVLLAPCFSDWQSKLQSSMIDAFLDESLPEGIAQERIKIRRI